MGTADGQNVIDFPPTDSTGATTNTGSPERVLDAVRDWWERFICTVDGTDLDLLTVWSAHTHVCQETYTTPRLILDSPVPGSGKTTVLEHLERLCLYPIQMASLSSPALLTRMLDKDLRTILIDEADRSLDPKKDGVQELLAVLNSGYKRGGTRPTLVPIKGGGWDAKEMPTFSPVAMAGNNPNLPDDTKSRSIRVLLMPDIDGTAEESDWEMIEPDARALGAALAQWADQIRDVVKTTRPDLPEGVRGRARERWGPLKRVALAAGGRWPGVIDDMARRDILRIAADRADGLAKERPAIVLLRHVSEVWKDDETFIPTTDLIQRLIDSYPEMWGDESPYGKQLTYQRLGRMLVDSYDVRSDRPGGIGHRGYLKSTLEPVFRRFGLDLPREPVEAVEPAEPAGIECDHGMPNGNEPDPFVGGLLACPLCRQKGGETA